MQSHLVDYFTSRDITMNEVLILNDGQQYMLFYTAGAKSDVRANLVRPSCHMKSSEMQVLAGCFNVWASLMLQFVLLDCI